MNAINATSSYQHTLDKIIGKTSFLKAFDVLTEQANLLAALDAVAHSNEIPDTVLVEHDIDIQLQAIAVAGDSDSFVKAFSKLSPVIKVILLFFVMQLLAVSQNIVANIVTPHVEKLISNPEITDREKIKKLKVFSFDGLDLSKLRFVTTERLLLRESPSSNSEIKNELKLGQIVSVIEKHRNWMEISYEDEDGEIIRGWVFSRYTAKFAPMANKQKSAQ
jgi:uncharacterized protein YgiM (DUF1202 family)